jgi:hypothetical protein
VLDAKGRAVAATPPPIANRETTVARSHRNLPYLGAWAIGLLMVAACQPPGDSASDPSPAVETTEAPSPAVESTDGPSPALETPDGPSAAVETTDDPSPTVETTDAPSEPADFSAAGLETAEVRSFLASLQQAVRNDDRQAVASLVSYPITVRIDGAPTTLADPAAFTAQYPEVMTEPVRAAIAAAEPATLFANSDGVMVGRGELWFGGVYEDGAKTYDIRIVGINPG